MDTKIKGRFSNNYERRGIKLLEIKLESVQKDNITKEWGKVYDTSELFYNYQYPSNLERLKHQDFNKLLLLLLTNKKNASALEMGCGRGIDSLFLAYKGYSLTALDYYELPLLKLERAKSYYEDKFSCKLNIQFVKNDFFRTELPQNSFDLVFNSGVIEHYINSSERIELIKQMMRITKDGGNIVIAFPNRFHPFVSIWDFIRKKFSNFESYELQEYFISSNQIKEEMEKAGMRNVQIKGIDVYNSISHYPNWFLLRLISYILRVILPNPSSWFGLKFGVRTVCFGQK